MRLSGQSLASSERSLIWQQIDEGQLPRCLCCCHQRRELCELGSPRFVSDLKAPSAREVGALATTDRRHRSQASGARGRDLLRDSVRCRGAEAAEKNLCIDGRCPESAVSAYHGVRSACAVRCGGDTRRHVASCRCPSTYRVRGLLEAHGEVGVGDALVLGREARRRDDRIHLN